MATIKQRLHKKNAAGGYDTIHLETGVDAITGVLPVAKGGTGVASVTKGNILVGNGTGAMTEMTPTELKQSMTPGGAAAGTPPTYPSTIGAVGTTMSWGNKTWRIVHKVAGMAVLALETMEETVQFSAYSNNGYFGSKLWCKCMEFAVSLSLFGADYIIPMCGLPVFAAGADQVGGGFSYFTSDTLRICKNTSGTAQNWWTSSPYSGNSVCCVNTSGTVGYNSSGNDPTYTYGFRPFVALRV